LKFFLTSQGIVPEITPPFLKLLSKKPESCRVAFIPTAADYKRKRGFWVSSDVARLEELGFDFTEINIKDENEKMLSEKWAALTLFSCAAATHST
jgi:peptidase E